MVLGLRTKNRKGTSVQVDYLVHIQEIKPWPPSQSLKSLRSVLLQWENGDRNSGSTNPVIPSLGSGVGDGKIEFNESFRLPVALSREFSLKSGDADTFQKNCVEFNLYEPRRDKTVKGQLLGTIIVDLAEYGVLKETQIISAPMNCKRSFRNTTQPSLFLKIEPYDKRGSGSSSRGRLSKEASLDMDGRESVSALMNGEYAEEAEIASFTDDDVSSHSSLTISSSVFEATRDTPPQNEENALEAVKEDSTRRGNGIPNLPLESVHAKPEVKSVSAALEHLNGSSSRSSSIDLSSGAGSPENDHERCSTSITGRSVTHSVQSSSSSITYEGTEEDVIHNNGTKSFNSEDLVQEVHGNIADDRSKTIDNAQQPIEENNTNDHETKVAYSDSDPRVSEKPGPVVSADTQYNEEDDCKLAGLMEDKYGEKHGEYLHTEQTENGKDHFIEDEPLNEFSQDDVRKLGVSAGDTTLSRKGLGVTGNILSSDRLRHVKSVRSPLELSRSNGSISNNQFMRQKEDVTLENARSRARSFIQNERKDTITASRDVKNSFSDSKVQQLQRRIENLERELREAAALEVSLYSIVAEHGSSANKVHAPARRLSRLYLHTGKEWSPGRRASAARSAVSGLVLVAKACGNDVPRLTFWLSNSVVLRAIISLALRDSRLSVSSPRSETNGGRKGNGEGSSPLKWKDCSPGKKENWFGCTENLDNWEDPQTFTTALEKIEAWIFSRIIESVWWQTLTPHMHSATEKACEQKICSGLRNSYGRKLSLGGQEQVNFSLELWKKAFKDACERLCPLRGAGHECGCLPVLARMVMEQCVSRLDVAMFNAILRESADEIPTDPVSDPISDPKVLPIPAGKSSFGAGAQLKNAIGNWSRWLTDLFGIDDDYSHEDEDGLDDYDRQECETSSKSFHLLNALSDLMMLPKDMLLNRSIRKEVCPTFGAPLIKNVLDNFAPDEFCPDPIPEAVFEALDAEDPFDAEEDSISNFPCNAAPVAYSPPSAALFMDIIGEFGKEPHLRRSGSSVLRKSYTSDDELDELDSPLVSITDCFRGVTTPTLEPKENVGQNVVRYQLLREVWRDGD